MQNEDRIAHLEKLLHDLTPGGSEFYGRPERCVQWIKDTLSSDLRQAVEAMVKKNAAEKRVEDLEKLLVVAEMRMRIAESKADLALAGQSRSLFQTGDFILHSGRKSTFKICCEALTDEDWDSLAAIISRRIKLSVAVGVPTGGLKLAAALEKYCSVDGNVLIVDDVLTTGSSLEEMRKKYPGALGVVVFARNECPSWVWSVFDVSWWVLPDD